MFELSDLVSVLSDAELAGAGDLSAERVEIDSRKELGGALFLALRGERFDGHDFVDAAIDSGAAAVCVSAEFAQSRKSRFPVPALVVPDTLKALQEIAAFHRGRFADLRVVGITGSSGKTSVKEMTRAILAESFGEDAVLDLYLPDENTPGERYALDIFKFSPFEDAVVANHPDPECPVSDMHTLKNSCISFPYFYSKDLIDGVENPHHNVKMEWVSDSGEKVHARIAGEFPEDQRFVYEITIDYDELRNQYRFQFKMDFWKLAPTGFEPLNFLMAGALRGRKELNRWSHSIYEDRFNKLRKIVHSNALFCATDYGEPPYWRQKSALTVGKEIDQNHSFLKHPVPYGCDLDSLATLPSVSAETAFASR